MVLCLREAESESTRQPAQPEPSGLFHLILRILVRIINRSREAMVPMNQPSGYALRAARMKTVCSPDSGPWWASPWGVGAGEGASPLPRTEAMPGHKQGHDSPTRQNQGSFSWEMLAEMLH